MSYYRTIFTVEVLSEYPLDVCNLATVDRLITEGGCSGVVTHSDSVELSAKEAAAALMAQGSDPEFFGLDSDGNEIDDEAP